MSQASKAAYELFRYTWFGVKGFTKTVNKAFSYQAPRLSELKALNVSDPRELQLAMKGKSHKYTTDRKAKREAEYKKLTQKLGYDPRLRVDLAERDADLRAKARNKAIWQKVSKGAAKVARNVVSPSKSEPKKEFDPEKGPVNLADSKQTLNEKFVKDAQRRDSFEKTNAERAKAEPSFPHRDAAMAYMAEKLVEEAMEKKVEQERIANLSPEQRMAEARQKIREAQWEQANEDALSSASYSKEEIDELERMHPSVPAENVLDSEAEPAVEPERENEKLENEKLEDEELENEEKAEVQESVKAQPEVQNEAQTDGKLDDKQSEKSEEPPEVEPKSATPNRDIERDNIEQSVEQEVEAQRDVEDEKGDIEQSAEIERDVEVEPDLEEDFDFREIFQNARDDAMREANLQASREAQAEIQEPSMPAPQQQPEVEQEPEVEHDPEVRIKSLFDAGVARPVAPEESLDGPDQLFEVSKADVQKRVDELNKELGYDTGEQKKEPAKDEPEHKDVEPDVSSPDVDKELTFEPEPKPERTRETKKERSRDFGLDGI